MRRAACENGGEYVTASQLEFRTLQQAVSYLQILEAYISVINNRIDLI